MVYLNRVDKWFLSVPSLSQTKVCNFWAYLHQRRCISDKPEMPKIVVGEINGPVIIHLLGHWFLSLTLDEFIDD